MKTILVIYTFSKVTKKKELRTYKQYAFNTDSDIKVGEMLNSDSYPDKSMQVTKVLDKSFTFYNASTGELSNEFTSTSQHEIANLEIRNDEENTIYATRVEEE